MKLSEIKARIAELEAEIADRGVELESLRAEELLIEHEMYDAHRDPEQPRMDVQPSGPGPLDEEPPGWEYIEYKTLRARADKASVPLREWLDWCLVLDITSTTCDQAKLRQLAGRVDTWVQGGRE